MKKEEYMSELKKALEGFDEGLVQEIITDYEEHFRVGIERGKTEEELIEELGTAEDLVEEVNEMLGIQSQVCSKPTENRESQSQAADGRKKEGGSEQTSEQEQKWSRDDKEKMSKSIKDMVAKVMEQVGRAVDTATEEMGKFDFDKIMKEVGDAMNEASQAAQEGFRRQKEAWKQKGNAEDKAWESNWDWDGSSPNEGAAWNPGQKGEDCKRVVIQGECADITIEETDDAVPSSPNEGAAWNPGQKGEDCKRVVIQGEFADVTIEETDDAVPSASYVQNSYKYSMMYRFYSYQEGDTFYIGFRKNGENAERKSGFFRMGYSCSADLNVRIPRGVECVELTVVTGNAEIREMSIDRLIVSSSSGDIELHELSGKSCKIKSVNGNVTMEDIQEEELELETSTGDIELQEIKGGNMQVKSVCGNLNLSEGFFDKLQGNTTSGDIELENVKANLLRIVTVSGSLTVSDSSFEEAGVKLTSGDVETENVEAKNIWISSGSGNINQQNVKAEQQKLESMSGDVEVDDCMGRQMEVSTMSGDINVSAEYEAYRLHASSGDIELCSQKDADVEAEGASGDINIEMRNVQSYYKVNALCQFGSASVSGQKKRDGEGAETRTITAKLRSGDIRVDFY